MKDKIMVDVTNPDKIFFPGSGITKGDLVAYYSKISRVMLPHLKDRPLTMHRFPEGIGGKGFFQQGVPDYFPAWIDTIPVAKKEGGILNRVLCNREETLVYLANQGCITPHIWLSQSNHLELPDKIVFDLDPSRQEYDLVLLAAFKLREVLEEMGLHTFVMTTGSKGLHIIVPMQPRLGFDAVRGFAREIAAGVADKNPAQFTIEQRKEKRGSRVYIDISRNAYGQTSVAPYAVRSIEGAPVATPLDWEEIRSRRLTPQRYHMKNIFRRLGQKEDPWKNIHLRQEDVSPVISKHSNQGRFLN